MLKAVKTDLEDACDIMEHLWSTLPRLTREEKVDLAARTAAIAKTAKRIDEAIKADIKTWRHGKMGYVIGEVWKAYLNIFPVTRLNQKKLEVELPKIYAKYLETRDEERVTFEAR